MKLIYKVLSLFFLACEDTIPAIFTNNSIQYKCNQKQIERAAVKWVETYLADPANIAQKKVIKKRSSTMLINRLQSNISGSSLSVWGRMTSFLGDEMTLVQENDDNKDEATTNRDGIRSLLQNLVVFSAGLTLGLLIASSSGMKSRSIRS